MLGGLLRVQEGESGAGRRLRVHVREEGAGRLATGSGNGGGCLVGSKWSVRSLGGRVRAAVFRDGKDQTVGLLAACFGKNGRYKVR